jgi:tripartite-type tricarboxylate transporter receptor subunit TctC
MKARSWVAYSISALPMLLVGCAATSPSPLAATSDPTKVHITVLYDAFGKSSAMQKDWGYAALIEYGGKRILFDTDNNSEILAQNAKAKGIDLSKLDFVVMSHRHDDHMRGMAHLLSVNPKVKIYAPKEGFAPVALISQVPFVLVVHPSLPARSVPELIDLAKEKPRQLFYASGGPGSPHHLLAELFKSTTGIQMTHVPYKGTAPAVADVAAGHVQVLFSDPVPALPLIREGKLRPLGVTTKTRLASAPEIPPIAEVGVPGFDMFAWQMIVAPANTPSEIVNRLHAELMRIVELPEVQQQLVNIGMIPLSSPPPEELQRFINAEIVRWGKIVHQAGLAGSE